MTLTESAVDLAGLYSEVGRQLASHPRPDDALAAVTRTAAHYVPGAEFAGITTFRDGRLDTVAPTDEIVTRVDAIQYELRDGPCVDAVLEESIFRVGDLRHDRRWPEFGRRTADEVGINSMLAIRLYVEDFDFLAGLNVYAHAEDAFDEAAETIVTILATHAALAVAGASARARATNLEKALTSNREIGVAMGVLMTQHKITRDQAFGLLRLASQNGNRKLADIASEVADTGVLRPNSPRQRAASATNPALSTNPAGAKNPPAATPAGTTGPLKPAGPASPAGAASRAD